MSKQHASVSQGRICSDNFTCCHTEIEVADEIFYLTQSQYSDTGPTSPSARPRSPGAWRGSHWSANDSARKKHPSQAGFEPRIFCSRGGRLNHYANGAVVLKELIMIMTMMTTMVMAVIKRNVGDDDGDDNIDNYDGICKGGNDGDGGGGNDDDNDDSKVSLCRGFTSRPPRWPSGKASASRAKDPGFESRLRRDFFGVESYQ